MYRIAIEPSVVELAEKVKQSSEKYLRGNIVDEHAFIVLWSGGYNVWADTKTLFETMESVIAQECNIHFVSTGGSISGHAEHLYGDFVKLVEQSKYKDNFHLLGWIEGQHVPNCFCEADLGINVDSFNNETIFGARNRITNMMIYSLPVLSTLGSEISYDLQKNNVGLTAEIGNVKELKEKILYAFNNKDNIKQMGKRAKEFALKEYAYGKTIEELRRWVKDPWFAPDNKIKLNMPGEDQMETKYRIKTTI